MNKNSLYQQQIENNRDVFVFNTELKSTEQKENIKKKNSIMADDQKIIDLRTSIRTASETKLENGIIDINNLLQDISAENQALIMKATHEIEYLKSIYDFKNTINNN